MDQGTGEATVDAHSHDRPLDLACCRLDVETEEETCKRSEQQAGTKPLDRSAREPARSAQVQTEHEVQQCAEQQVDMSGAKQRPRSISHADEMIQLVVHELTRRGEGQETRNSYEEVRDL